MMDEMVCYCFNYTARDIGADVLAHGRSTILERILAEKRAGACQCTTRNPRGR